MKAFCAYMSDHYLNLPHLFDPLIISILFSKLKTFSVLFTTRFTGIKNLNYLERL